jgi:hypothetical protein
MMNKLTSNVTAAGPFSRRGGDIVVDVNFKGENYRVVYQSVRGEEDAVAAAGPYALTTKIGDASSLMDAVSDDGTLTATKRAAYTLVDTVLSAIVQAYVTGSHSGGCYGISCRPM